MAKTAVIIGGGIAGCATAYALAKRGLKVTLLEQHAELGQEASGNPCAMLYPRLSGCDTLSDLNLAAYSYSLKFYQSLNLEADAFNTCGMLQLGFNARELARIQKVATQFQQIDSIKYVNTLQASQLAGTPLLHDALYIANAGWVKPQALLKHLTQDGNISTITLSKVYKILIINNIFNIHFDENQHLEADIVVITNANEARHFVQSAHIHTQAVRGQVSFLQATPDSQALKAIICTDGYLSPSINGMHSLGATFSTQNLDLTITEQDHQANLNILKTLFPALYKSIINTPLTGRASLRCTTADYFPLLGPLLDAQILSAKPPRPSAKPESLPWINGLYINTAHGSRGFTSAPFCAELLAQMICNEPLNSHAEMAGLLNPNRFILKKMGLKRLSKVVCTSQNCD